MVESDCALGNNVFSILFLVDRWRRRESLTLCCTVSTFFFHNTPQLSSVDSEIKKLREGESQSVRLILKFLSRDANETGLATSEM